MSWGSHWGLGVLTGASAPSLGSWGTLGLPCGAGVFPGVSAPSLGSQHLLWGAHSGVSTFPGVLGSSLGSCSESERIKEGGRTQRVPWGMRVISGEVVMRVRGTWTRRQTNDC